MPWVCSVCSTNNEDGNELCFVCDAPRPVAPPPSPAPASTTGVRTLTRNRVASLRLRGDVVVPEEFNAIGESAFAGRRDISSVTLHAGVKKIGASAFSGCHALSRIVGGEGLTSIGARAFYDCPALSGARPRARYMADDAFAMPATPTARPTPPP
ncbi:MAG: leucine-rich repeat protein, partial [Clostridia bacterium]|nr:leucine-rich repeat protein [Clostridia bacterium]